jgi:hypothetical protein
MALVGNIKDFGLSDFLYLVDRGYKTGCLYLSREEETAILFFEKGKLIYATLNEGEHVGDLLLRLEKVTPDQVDTARSLQQGSSNGMTLTQAFIDGDIFSQEDLQQVLQTYIEESVVYGLFGWPDGEFRFEHGQKPELDAPVMPMPVPVEHLIMEGVRRIDEWGRIKDRIPNTDMIVRFVDQPGEKAKGVKLAPEEWRVFARINGKDSLATIAQKTSLSDFDVCRVVYGFATAGLVEVVKKPVARPGRSSEGPRVKKSLVSRIINRIEKM